MELNSRLLEAAMNASLDQLDQMLAELADELQTLSQKHSKWSLQDIYLVEFCIRATAARAIFIKDRNESCEY